MASSTSARLAVGGLCVALSNSLPAPNTCRSTLNFASVTVKAPI
jgi:hypothetical protein